MLHRTCNYNSSLTPCIVSLTPCYHGEVRLVGGCDVSEGRVEVCVYGLWGTICSGSNWGTTEAEIVCNQLGLESSGEVTKKLSQLLIK